ncbi:MAG: FkbM family methyltransferase [Thalassobaculaceae bacterium]|nr:FkbM family methyltransferase [Thalassobaculaceae bacterium]
MRLAGGQAIGYPLAMDIAQFFASPEHAVADTVSGPMVCFRNDTGVSDTLIRFGEYAAGERFLYRSLLAPGDVFVDVGANIGAISAALLRGPVDYEIWAFEPQPVCQAVAAANLLGGLGARVLPFAVGDRDGMVDVPELDLRRRGNYGQMSVGDTAGRTVPAPIVRLDSFLKDRAPAPRLIKIDVEGLERAVIAGAEGLFHPRLVLSIEADRPEVVETWLPALVTRGMACYLLFLSNVAPSNPRFDATAAKCRVRFPQIVAFAGAPEADFATRYAMMRLTGMDEYRARMTPTGGAQPASVSTDSP